MGAREKLNAAFVNGALLVAAVLGGIAQSWGVFLIAALVLLGLALHSGDIRTVPRPPRSRDRHRRS